MKNISLFFIGIILLVFAAFFHVYRYGMSQEKSAPPPAPIPVQEEKPKLIEPEVTTETSKLPEGDTKPEEKPKALAPETPAPKTQVDLGVENNNNLNIGTDEFEGLKK